MKAIEEYQFIRNLLKDNRVEEAKDIAPSVLDLRRIYTSANYEQYKRFCSTGLLGTEEYDLLPYEKYKEEPKDLYISSDLQVTATLVASGMKMIDLKVIDGKGHFILSNKAKSITLATPELNPNEMAEIMNLQGINLNAVFTPLDERNAPVYKVDKELETKTPSNRLRATLWRLWEQEGSKGDFDQEFYNMNKFIEVVKEKLE